ncbi:GroES-like protein [Atractiella rhizophila]|nr:GroES-like protein [Atractiella rhizophila]
MPPIPEKFTGYAALHEVDGKALTMKVYKYTPKKFAEDDVTIKITHCGVCGSDVHQLKNGWPDYWPTSYPCICGHEVVGEVVEAGKNTEHSIGDRVGVGAQARACLECQYCTKGYPQYCEKGFHGTYQGHFEDDSLAQGGYADYMRTKGAFAVKIPEKLSSEHAAPFLCAGIAVYSPLRRFEAGPGKKVGVIGIGGLGHLALQFSKAMGADTYALSSSNRKMADCVKMGIEGDNYINYSDTEGTLTKHSKTFDLLLSTTSGSGMPLDSLFLPLLRPFGTFCIAGLPEEKLPSIMPHYFILGISLTGTQIGSPQKIREMLEFAAETGVRPWIEVRGMKEIDQALKDVEVGKPRYRYVMKN